METFVLPIPTLRRLLQLLAAEAARPCYLTVGRRDAGARRDWLARDVRTDAPDPRGQVFEVRAVEAIDAFPPREVLPGAAGLLMVGTHRIRGHISITSIDGHRHRPIEIMSLVGAGMHTLDLRSPHRQPLLPATATAGGASAALQRWSRTIGALGGERAWQRLVDLKMTVIGAGRTGSVIAQSLIATGVRDLTIVDPDLVELHNVGESDALVDRDVGLHKSAAVVRHLRERCAGRDQVVEGLAASIWERPAVELAKRSDVIVTCVDRDGPRLAATLIAAAHHRLIVDIGTGVVLEAPDRASAGEGPRRRIGADVRVIPPGEGCLLCRGGLTDYDGAVQQLTTRDEGAASFPSRNVFGPRVGSLRSLNLLAAGAALRLLEGIVTGDGQGGWMHLEDDWGGRLEITYPSDPEESGTAARIRDCPICRRAGLGDAVI